MKEENLFKIISWLIPKLIVWLVITIYSLSLYYSGKCAGYKKAKEEIQAQANLDNKTLENHAKELKTIHSESDSAVSARLRKNIGAN